MSGPRYSVEQLEALKESPLVKKPDGLPSISQWMDIPAEAPTNNNNSTSNNGTARRTRGMRDTEGASSSENRPLMNPMGQFGRRQSTQPGEDTVLGPPKLSFTSASRTLKTAGDCKERGGIGLEGDNLGDRFPREKNERWVRDRDGDRNRDKGFVNGRRTTREDGEGWTSVKGRKSVGQEDFERFGRGDRHRDKQDTDLEGEGVTRRGNRERADTRWGRRDDMKDEGLKSGVHGGWRDRDRDRERERERERDWNRGGNKAEEDPEWMDTKIEKKETKIHTQEDFQRWKEAMRAKDTPLEEKDEPKGTPADGQKSTASGAPAMLTAPLHTPSAEPTQGVLFGNWGRDKTNESGQGESILAKPKPDKKSRFMNMFAKPEESLASPQHAPPPMPASPPPAIERNADQEGFQRILQMLGGVNIGGSQAAQPSAPAFYNDARHGGGISLDFHQQSPPPEPQNTRPPPRTHEQQSLLDNILTPRPAAHESRLPQPQSQPQSQPLRYAPMTAENIHQQLKSLTSGADFSENAFPHRQMSPQVQNLQDANINALVDSRRRDDQEPSGKQTNRDFLLTLMQGQHGTPPQMGNPNLPRHNPENDNGPFFEQTAQRGHGIPRNRGGLPPGFMEDPRMFNENEAMRREQELRQQLNMQQQQQQEALRAKNARLPMGLAGHEDPLLQLQRRSTAGEPRQLTNMGIPSQPIPDMPFMGGRGQSGMPLTPQDRPNIAPPPGFAMRQPHGLGGNPQQQMGPGGASFSAGNTPLGHPPGFAPPNNMRTMGFPGGPGGPGGPGTNGMQGPPQGYFPPPGYGPPMPNMRGEDPRMMFEGQFGNPGPRQQQPGRPGPLPPNMY